MKEIAEEPSLRKTGTVVEVDHPKRGKYLRHVGNPIKMSDSATEVTRSPLLGEHTDEVLAELGYSSSAQVAELRSSGAIWILSKSKCLPPRLAAFTCEKEKWHMTKPRSERCTRQGPEGR